MWVTSLGQGENEAHTETLTYGGRGNMEIHGAPVRREVEIGGMNIKSMEDAQSP